MWFYSGLPIRKLASELKLTFIFFSFFFKFVWETSLASSRRIVVMLKINCEKLQRSLQRVTAVVSNDICNIHIYFSLKS